MKKIIVALMLALLPLLGDELKSIKDDLQKRADDITVLIADQKINQIEKNKKILEKVDSIMDFELMSTLSLDKNDRQKLTDAQLKEFSTLFEKELKDAFLEKLKNYSNDKIELKDALKTKKDRISVPSVIHSKKEDMEVIFKYYLQGQQEWKIYDLEVAGVSLIQTYRAQFSEIMATAGADKLFEKLRKRQ